MIKIKATDLEILRQEEERQKQAEVDRDLLLADVMLLNAELQRAVNDLSLVVADLMTRGVKQ